MAENVATLSAKMEPCRQKEDAEKKKKEKKRKRKRKKRKKEKKHTTGRISMSLNLVSISDVPQGKGGVETSTLRLVKPSSVVCFEKGLKLESSTQRPPKLIVMSTRGMLLVVVEVQI